MSQGKVILETRDLVKLYKIDSVEVKALQGVSITIAEGEFVCLMGRSGSGKSTLMHIVGCLDRPTSGSVIIEGRETEKLNDNELAMIRNEKLGFVFQTFNLLPRVTAIQNVELPLIYGRAGPTERKERAKRALDAVGLGSRLFHRPSQLSGGEQQRVAIARALVNNPAIILADEPTGNIDYRSSVEIMAILQDLNAQGRTVLLVTHEPDLANYAGRIIHLLDGMVIADGKVFSRRDARQQLRMVATDWGE